MVVTIPTDRAPNERVESAPTHCPAGHPLDPGQPLVGYGVRPDGARARSWMCRACGLITWDDRRRSAL